MDFHFKNDTDDLYTYLSVVYCNDITRDIDNHSFYYKTDIEGIKAGDYVLVDSNGKEIKGKVVKVEYRLKDNLPYPLEKTKDIISVFDCDIL